MPDKRWSRKFLDLNPYAERYRILGKLGQGGVGITYAAVDLNSNQKVALKALSLRLTTE
ncbi:hypothetical protein [Microcoleus sp. Pol17_C1]|uniref:hypothetical protein n=1 Tax=unclassified Microcoleus TaxID=2642155 RepID=UPI002FD28C31